MAISYYDTRTIVPVLYITRAINTTSDANQLNQARGSQKHQCNPRTKLFPLAWAHGRGIPSRTCTHWTSPRGLSDSRGEKRVRSRRGRGDSPSSWRGRKKNHNSRFLGVPDVHHPPSGMAPPSSQHPPRTSPPLHRDLMLFCGRGGSYSPFFFGDGFSPNEETSGSAPKHQKKSQNGS
jgi:hypothetical protein